MDAQELIALFRQSPTYLSDEVKARLKFAKMNIDQSDEWIDGSADMRESITKILYGNAIDTDLPLLHYLIEEEAQYCAEIWGSTHTLTYLERTLFYLGNFSSLPVLWRCKHISFDTYAVIGSPELFGAGIDKTIAYLEDADIPDRDELIKYLKEELDTKPIREIVDKLSDRVNKRFSNT